MTMSNGRSLESPRHLEMVIPGLPKNHSTEGCDLRLWGKQVDGRTYPVAAHLVDTAAAAVAACDDWMGEGLLRRRAERVGVEYALLRSIVIAAAGKHDLGKLNPVFQAQTLHPAGPRFNIPGGYWQPEGNLAGWEAGDLRRVRRHEHATLRMLGNDLTDPVAVSCAGHHGRWLFEPPIPDDLADDVDFYDELLADPSWAAQHHAHIQLIDQLTAAGAAGQVPNSLIPFITSIVCVADWLASSDTSLQHGTDHLEHLAREPAHYFDERVRWMSEFVPDTLGTPPTFSAPASTIFGFNPDRPLQQLLSERTDPGLAVVTAPTGDGKTEAAILRWLTTRHAREGLFFALPTTATADAMFTRIRSVFEQADTSAPAALAHSRAILNSFYDQPGQSIRVQTEPDPTSGLHPDHWFRGRHRALLAPITVGTVDQLLRGTLRSKYSFLRLFGAQTKHVVIDEVHTFDPYMDELLVRFLDAAGAAGTNVTLLSATLPARRTHRYLDAYTQERTDTTEPTTFPGVVFADRKSRSAVAAPSGRGRRNTILRYHQLPDSPNDRAPTIAALVAELHDRHPDAKIGVICNTVTTTQQVAADLTEQQLDVPLWCLHSRMLAAQRAEITDRVLDAAGLRSSHGGTIVVASQILEASIDADFDILISQLAPAASLVQRIGRVWRHRLDGRDRHRPNQLDKPVAHIVHGDPNGFATWNVAPYHPLELTTTWTQALTGGQLDELSDPDDIQRFVEAGDVSFDDIVAHDNDGSYQLDIIAKQGAANAVAIPTTAVLDRDVRKLEHLAPSDGSTGSTATRLNERPTETLVVIDQPNLSFDINGNLTADQRRVALAATVPVNGAAANDARRIADNSNDPAIIPYGGEDPLLFNTLLLASAASPTFEFDPHLGLLHHKEPHT